MELLYAAVVKPLGVSAQQASNGSLINVITVVIIDRQHVFIHFSSQ